MGIPYSREINKAFEELNKAYGQVTPLVAAAYEVLETTKNISLVLLAIQVLTVVLLGLILVCLLGLLITMNPDMQAERSELVTPVMRWVAGWVRTGMTWTRGIGTFVVVVGVVGLAAVVILRPEFKRVEGGGMAGGGEGEGIEGGDGDGKDDGEQNEGGEGKEDEK